MSGRDDDDGDVELLAQAAADVEAVDAGQHEVEDDEVKASRQSSLHALAAIALNRDLEVRCLEIIALELRDLAVILDNQYLLHTVSTFPVSMS